MTNPVLFWADEKTEILKTLYAKGLSASLIASELGGISRNAVIGKVHRLGLERRGKTAGMLRSVKVKKPRIRSNPYVDRWNTSRPKSQEIQSAISAVAYPLNIPFADIGAMQCRWITSDDHAPVTFCGHFALTGSWCDGHRAQVYQPAVKRLVAA